MYFLDVYDIKNWTAHNSSNETLCYELDDFEDELEDEHEYLLGQFFPSQILELQNVLCYLGCLDSELL